MNILIDRETGKVIDPVGAGHSREAEETPARLPKDFLWSRFGTKHVDYPSGQTFEGDAATVGNSGLLGTGGFGSVTAVVCKGQLLARKRMHFARLDADCKREAGVLKDIIHPHIIQLVGSYTLDARFFILLHPVADCNLKEYFQMQEKSRTITWENSLKGAFGCLAAPVAFLHSAKVAVKHKDIKPSNILMFGGTPMLTDFGLSNSFKGEADSISLGVTGKTALYAAPEVVAALPRGTSQDVFSLGLVLREMLWALHGHSEGSAIDLDGGLRDGPWPGNVLDHEEVAFAKDLPKLAFDWATQLRDELFLTRLIRIMTAKEPSDRPSAVTVWKCFQVPSFYGALCGSCCHEDPKLYNRNCKAQRIWTRTCSTLTSYVRTSRDTSRQTHLPESLPYDSSGTYKQSSTLSPVPAESPQSGYERLLADQGFLPRLEDQYDWSGRGMHVEYSINEHVPLRAEKVLAHGNRAIIETVRCHGRMLARKSVRMAEHRKRTDHYIAEIGILQRLRHRHVVQLLGSYTHRRTLSLLQYPVADLNLSEMLLDIRERSERDSESARDDRIAIKRFFACLSQAIQHVHEEHIRHKDIKPQNILIRHLPGGRNISQVYLTDFELSLQYLQEEEAKSEGPSVFTTRRYAAPEVLSCETRSFAADIFSLGCVFLEMQTAVLGPLYAGLPELMLENEDPSYQANQDLIDKWVEQLGDHPRSQDGLQISQRETRARLKTVRAMLDPDPSKRPMADDLALRFGANECCNLDREDFWDERIFVVDTLS